MPEQYINIITTHTALPAFSYTADQISTAFEGWLKDQDRALQVKAQRVLRNAGIAGRRSFLGIEEIFSARSLTESSRRYREEAIAQGTAALAEALGCAGVRPDQVDVLITTSCTGYMIPSVDAYLADALGMRADLIRLPVTEVGCAAGASAMIYACEMLRGHPGRVAVCLNIEFPTNTMQHDDYSMDNIVATALFSDGIACTVLRNESKPGRVRVSDWAMHQVGRTTGILGYQLGDTGFRMNLDASLPDLIGAHFEDAADAMLSRNELMIEDIRHFVIHPGGVKILDRIDEVLARFGQDAHLSREVMSRLGNMSSSTVVFILDALIRSDPEPGPGLLMSFGPGFGAHQLLLHIGEANGS